MLVFPDSKRVKENTKFTTYFEQTLISAETS